MGGRWEGKGCTKKLPPPTQQQQRAKNTNYNPYRKTLLIPARGAWMRSAVGRRGEKWQWSGRYGKLS
jgi:hypothetical protein